jgi:hypothetical protein
VCRTSGCGYESFRAKKTYYRQDVSGVTPFSIPRNVEWKMISVGIVIARYVISNLPSKETDKQTSRKFDTSYSWFIIDCRCIWVTGERKTEAVRQHYDNPHYSPRTVHNFLYIHRVIFVCCVSQSDLLSLGQAVPGSARSKA